jgi:hypothetical protein
MMVRRIRRKRLPGPMAASMPQLALIERPVGVESAGAGTEEVERVDGGEMLELDLVERLVDEYSAGA